DVAKWAETVAHFLRPGGRLYFAEMHPTAAVLGDEAPEPDGRPGWVMPYFHRGGMAFDDPGDYADPDAQLRNARTVNFIHPVADILAGLMAAGLRLEWLHEHDRLTWRQFRCLVKAADGCW